jgi:hypothetical protein
LKYLPWFKAISGIENILLYFPLAWWGRIKMRELLKFKGVNYNIRVLKF